MVAEVPLAGLSFTSWGAGNKNAELVITDGLFTAAAE